MSENVFKMGRIGFCKGPNRPELGAESTNTGAESTRHEGPSWLKEGPNRPRLGAELVGAELGKGRVDHKSTN